MPRPKAAVLSPREMPITVILEREKEREGERERDGEDKAKRKENEGEGKGGGGRGGGKKDKRQQRHTADGAGSRHSRATDSEGVAGVGARYRHIATPGASGHPARADTPSPRVSVAGVDMCGEMTMRGEMMAR